MKKKVVNPPQAGADPAHDYKSTACLHGQHADCRLSCKFCDAKCSCECHKVVFTELQFLILESLGWDTAELRELNTGALPAKPEQPKRKKAV